MITRQNFNELGDKAFGLLKPSEGLTINLTAEDSTFLRVNNGMARQPGEVQQASLRLTYVSESSGGLKKSVATFDLSGELSTDSEKIVSVLSELRKEAEQSPVDPYAQKPLSQTAAESTDHVTAGKLPSREEICDKLLTPLQGREVSGLYVGGSVLRAMKNSEGLSHWFSSETFSFDYSFYTKEKKALKGNFAGNQWDQAKYEAEVSSAVEHLAALERPSKRVARGHYRTYLAPSAVEDLVRMFSWGCIGEDHLRQGESPLRMARTGMGARHFSPLFNLRENFKVAHAPRFNSFGESAPDVLPLITEGQLKNTLICPRTAKQFGLVSNGANDDETLQAPEVLPGTLKESEILSALGEGLYLSNLHYLNWSDQPGGRVTGMTRYACFWVENGKIVAPIENMRWDDNIFHLFGDNLEALTTHRTFIPNPDTYFRRGLSGCLVPGALLKRMEFTL